MARVLADLWPGLAQAGLHAVWAVPGARLADIGCGTGSMTAAAVARGAAVTAVDAEPGMVRATAGHGGPAAGSAVGALPSLPLRRAGFDAVQALWDEVIEKSGGRAPRRRRPPLPVDGGGARRRHRP